MKGLVRVDILLILAILGFIATILLFTTPLHDIVVAGLRK